MIKAFVYTITLFIFFSSATQASEKITFKYNIDKSLPQDWVKEFKNIMDILHCLIIMVWTMENTLNLTKIMV